MKHKIGGLELDEKQLWEIHRYAEVLSIAEYMEEIVKGHTSDDLMKYASEVYNRILKEDDDNSLEQYFVQEVISEFNL